MDDIEIDFGAISLDNATLRGEGYRFEEGLLAQIRQFKDSPVTVVQTDIVHEEAIRHIGEMITAARNDVRKGLRSAEKHLRLAKDKIDAADQLLSVDGHETDIALGLLNKFYDDIGARVLDSAAHANLSDLIKMYHSNHAPFETREKKKYEFPDAISLLALEGWAEQNETKVIAVSQDKGWRQYAETSSRITVLPSLADALEQFQSHHQVQTILDHIRTLSLFEDPESDLFDRVKDGIATSVRGYDITVEAYSNFYYEWEDTSAAYISHSFAKDPSGEVKMSVVGFYENIIVLKVSATVEARVEATFDFYIRDSVDKDYVPIGVSVITTEESYETDVLVSLIRTSTNATCEFEVLKVEVLNTLVQANFGEVEPDWND